MIRTYKECDKCKQNISKSNFNKHIKRCDGVLDYWAKRKHGLLEIDTNVECKFCNKINKNANSNRNHQRLCKVNPNKQLTFIEKNPYLFKAENPNHINSNHFIKAKKLGLPKPIVSQETRNKLSIIRRSRSDEYNKKIGAKVSETVSQKMLEGTWHTYADGKFSKKYIYKGILFDSSWEMKYAMWLDSMDIEWERCKNKFPYEFENKKKNYIPDFFLKNTQEYIEIKGLKTDRDIAKWEQFPKDLKLTILMESDLKSLGVL